MDLVDQVTLRLAGALDLQDVVRVDGTIHQGIACDNARETARDVLLLRGFAGDLHQHVAGVHGLTVLDHQMRAGGQEVTAPGLAVVALDLDARLLLLVR